MHILEQEAAFELCVILFNSDHSITEPELRAIAMHGSRMDAAEYDAGLAFAKEQRWMRLSHAQSLMTLTQNGMRAMGHASAA